MWENGWLEYINLLEFSIFLKNVYSNKGLELNNVKFINDVQSKDKYNISILEYYFKNLKTTDAVIIHNLNMVSKIQLISFYLNVDEYWSKIICFNSLKKNNNPKTFSLLLLSVIETKNIENYCNIKKELLDPNLFLYKLFQDTSNHFFFQLLKFTILKFNPDLFDFDFTLGSKSDTEMLNELKMIYKNFNYQGYCHLLPKSIFKKDHSKTQLIFLENSYTLVSDDTFVSFTKNEPKILDFCFRTLSNIFFFVSRFSEEIVKEFKTCTIFVNNVSYLVAETTNKKTFSINIPNTLDKIDVKIRMPNNKTLKILPIKIL